MTISGFVIHSTHASVFPREIFPIDALYFLVEEVFLMEHVRKSTIFIEGKSLKVTTSLFEGFQQNIIM